jgi:DNA polymerase III delta prime subunit
MAHMIPAFIDPRTLSHGEKEVFRRMRDDPQSANWIVFHSLDIAHPAKRLAAEVDFVILIPTLGMLCLEVKATSEVRRKDGLWYYGSDSIGDPRGPFKQAAAAMHEVRRLISKGAPALSGIVVWSAVLFPYLRFDRNSPEWHPWQVVDRQGFTGGLARACRQVLVNAHRYLQERESAGWYEPAGQRPTPAECAAVVGILRPEFELYQSVRARASERETELKHYTDEQFIALDAMQRNPRVLFEGPAGVGKTLLAMEGARRASAVGRRTLLLCFNRLLAGFLSTEMRHDPAVRVSTLHALMLKTLGNRDVGANAHRTEFWSQELPEAAAVMLLEREDERYIFDEMLVDEAQDILFPLYLDFLDLVLRGGLATGRWRFFGDLEKQALFGSPVPALKELLERRARDVSQYSLRVNCRNVPRIAALSCILGALHPPYLRILRPDGGIEPEMRYHRSQEQQIADLRSTIDAALNTFRAQDIVVLSPRARGSSAERLNAQSGNLRLQPLTEPRRRGLTYATVHAFKGLEAPCIILTDIEHVGDEASQALFYTAVTRAQDRLVVLADEGCRAEVVRSLTAGPMEATG